MSTENDATSTPWVPLGYGDYALLLAVSWAQTISLGMCVHLWWNRKWPPYITKNVDLVATCAFAGVLWTGALAVEVGFVRRREGDVLATCSFEYFMSWSTLAVHAMSFFIRLYRMWRVLVKHDDKMWRAINQILFMSIPGVIPGLAAWVMPNAGEFDEVTNLCTSTKALQVVIIGMDVWGFIGITFLWRVCARQLKFVRKQFNEYDTTKRTLILVTLALASFGAIVSVLLINSPVARRRVAIIYPAITTHTMLWGPIYAPFVKKMLGDQIYLMSYTKGFSDLPSPAQLKASLAEQLSVDQLRTEFRRYIQTKIAQELIDFYLESLDREEVIGFFERQAVTMRIVERFIREGAPDQVNISEECREKVLNTDVTDFDIFEEARAEVLALMETNFQIDFVATEGFRRIADASAQQQREMEVLRAGGMLPFPPPTAEEPATTAMPRVPRVLAKFRKVAESHPDP